MGQSATVPRRNQGSGDRLDHVVQGASFGVDDDLGRVGGLRLVASVVAGDPLSTCRVRPVSVALDDGRERRGQADQR